MLYRHNLKLSFLSLFALMVLLPAAAYSQTVVRGPYLQMATPTSIIVRWRTDVATDSIVAYAQPGVAAQTRVSGQREPLHEAGDTRGRVHAQTRSMAVVSTSAMVSTWLSSMVNGGPMQTMSRNSPVPPP